MTNKKELINKLEELRKTNKIVVGVYQNNLNNKKMELVNVWEDEITNLKQFTSFLYSKTILKTNIKIKYQYNYSDKQIITFVDTYTNYDNTKTITEYKFFNVPTKMGYLDIMGL